LHTYKFLGDQAEAGDIMQE